MQQKMIDMQAYIVKAHKSFVATKKKWNETNDAIADLWKDDAGKRVTLSKEAIEERMPVRNRLSLEAARLHEKMDFLHLCIAAAVDSYVSMLVEEILGEVLENKTLVSMPVRFKRFREAVNKMVVEAEFDGLSMYVTGYDETYSLWLNFRYLDHAKNMQFLFYVNDEGKADRDRAVNEPSYYQVQEIEPAVKGYLKAEKRIYELLSKAEAAAEETSKKYGFHKDSRTRKPSLIWARSFAA